MKKFVVFVLAFMVSSYIASQDVSGFSGLLKRIDSLVTFPTEDLSAEYLIVKRDPGGASSTTKATMFRRDRKNEFLVLILEPDVDKGKGYLKLGDSLWLYDPIGHSFTFTSAKERFQNSSARNSDFNRSNFAGDYTVIAGRKEKLGQFECNVLDLQATNNTVSFPKVTIWVSTDNLVRQIKDHSLSGQLMRTTGIPGYQLVGNRWIPNMMVILDHLKSIKLSGKIEYERTTITITKPSLAPLPDYVYSKEYLERVGK